MEVSRFVEYKAKLPDAVGIYRLFPARYVSVLTEFPQTCNNNKY